MFYINYVVCKFNINIKIRRFRKQFYINYVVCKYKIGLSTKMLYYSGFILTMWYVNYKVGDLWVQGTTGFYINYVVCKCWTGFHS